MALLLAPGAWAQTVSLTTINTSYSQNFDGLSNTAGSTTNSVLPTGFFLTETGGGARDNEQYAVDTGGSNTGDTYSYGAAGATDRAFGGLRSGTLISVIGAAYTNNTGSTITSLNISYTGEEWRLGTAARTDQLNFEYSTNATDLATGTWTAVTALNFITPNTVTIGVKNGNDATNRTDISGAISGLSIPNGATFWIRFTDTDASGADDGLAIDDFSLTPVGTAGPVTPTLSINDVSVTEGNTGTITATFSVSLSSPATAGGVTFDIATADNTATTTNNDYVAKSLTGQTIPAGSSTYSFSVEVNGDTDFELNETFFVNVTNVTGATVSDGQGLGTITNDDVSAFPIVSIAATDATGAEAASDPITFTVSRTGDVTNPMNVTYTVGGMATNGTDYTPTLAGTVTIPTSQSSVVITLTPVDDDISDPSETVVLTLTDGEAYDLGTASATATITDNEALPATLISAIQGSGATFNAAFGGTQTIEGIVTRTFSGTTGLSGFYLQEEETDSDGNPTTSEGIFIFDNSTVFSGNQGDKVRVTGAVSEFVSSGRNLTQITLANAGSFTVVNTGNALPAATTVQLPVTNISDLERYEGMLVTVQATQGNLTVTDNFTLGRFGQVVLAATDPATNQPETDPRIEQFTQFNLPSVSGNATYQANIARRLIILDDANPSQNPSTIIHARGGNPLSSTNTLRAGDDVASITGILDDRFEGYRVQTNTGVNFNATNARLSSPPAVGGSLKVAGFNVLNYFTDLDNNQVITIPDGVSFEPRGAETAIEFTRQRDKIIAAITAISPDVLGVIEMENNGPVAIQNLVDGLNAISGAGSYTFVNDANLVNDPNPQVNAVGTDAIKVGFIYKPGSVTPVGLPMSSSNTVFDRPPVAQTFQQNSNGSKFTAIVNHFKSKGSGSGANADQNDGQGASNADRVAQANALISFIPSVTAVAGDPDVLMLGDYNAYAQEDPIRTLAAAGYVSLRTNADYSYAFDGQFGFLDYAFANASMTAQVSGSADWHINSDEPIILDYNTNFKQDQPSNLYNADPFRASDHDPVVVGLSLTPVTAPLALTLTASPTQLLTTGTTTLSATVSGGTTPYSYTFTGPGTISTSGNTASVSSLSAGVQTFTVVVADATTPTSQTISATVSVTVNDANTVPVATPNDNQTATVGETFSYTVNAFTDSETPDGLTYTVVIDPANELNFNVDTRVISGVPSMSGVSSVTVIATDPGSLSASTSFTITISPAPVVVTPLALTLTAEPTAILTTGTTTLSAAVSGGTTPYSYTFLGPDTITPGGNTATASGLTAGVQTFTVLVSDATTPTSQTISATVSVTVSEVNTAPTVANAIPPQSATVGQAFSYTIPANTFTDAETPDGLVLSVSGLPAGLSFTAPATISGTPSTTMGSPVSVTVTATDSGSLSVSTSLVITISPASVTTTAPFAITGVSMVTCTPVANQIIINFNPQYAGLSGQPISFSVVNELSPTSAAGPYSLSLYADNPVITLKATQGGTAGEASFVYNWLAVCNSQVPGNTAPTVANPIPPQSATVGQGFSYGIPAGTFTDAETPASLVLSVNGLPSGLSFTAPATISGTPSMSGTSTVTVVATDPGSLSVSTSFTITVSPASVVVPPTSPFSITGVTTVSCTPVANQIIISFNPQYAGLSGEPISFSVVNELSPTTAAGPYSLSLYTDNPVITLKATQSGTVGEASFVYNWLAACTSQVPGNTAPTVANPIPPQSVTVGQSFTYGIPAGTFTDAETPNDLVLSVNGLPSGLSFTAPVTISGTPSMSGTSTVIVTATDPGSLSVSTSFTITVSPSSTTSTSPFAIAEVSTVSCSVISAGQRQVSFSPQYAGLNGQPISFSVVNELSPTTAEGPYTLNLYTDNPTITLKATQSGTSGEASFVYNWLAACNSPARLGVEPVAALEVRVLGNPAQNGQVWVEVSGAAGQPLRLHLTDMRGQTLGSHQVKQAGSVESHRFAIGREWGGVLLLRASTPTQSQTVKVLQAD